MKLREYWGSRIAIMVVLLLCLTLVGGLWGGLFVELRLDRERVIESRFQENENLVQVLAEHTTRTIRAAEVVMAEIRAEYGRSGETFDLVRFWRNRSLYLDPSNVVAVLDETGKRVLTSIAGAKPANYGKSELFQYHLRNNSGVLHISKPNLGRASGKWTFYLSRRINKVDGSFGGCVIYGLDPAYFARIFKEISLGRDAVVNLVGRDGIIRARNTFTKLSAGQDVSKTPMFTKLLPKSSHGNFIKESVLDKVPRIFSYRAMKDFPLIVLIGTSQAVALVRYEERKSSYLLAGSGITVIIVLFGLILMSMIARTMQANEELEHRVEKRTAELREVQAELVKKERLATLGQLAASVSHELRNPLGAISMSLSLVDAKVEGHGLGVGRAIERMKRSIGRCDRIIDEMLDFARDRNLLNVPTNLDKWLRELLGEQLLPDGITLRYHLNAGGSRVSLDPELFRRVIINLYNNACDAMLGQNRDGGNGRGHELVAETRCVDGHAEISIIDNGPGMPAEVLASAFEPLFSTKNFGVGLGLAIVRKIIEQHSGAIKIDSKPGGGTRVTLTIPLQQPEAEACRRA